MSDKLAAQSAVGASTRRGCYTRTVPGSRGYAYRHSVLVDVVGAVFVSTVLGLVVFVAHERSMFALILAVATGYSWWIVGSRLAKEKRGDWKEPRPPQT